MTITESYHSIKKLCSHPQPYEAPAGYETLFLAAMRENIQWHATRSPFYAQFLKDRGFSADALASFGDCAGIPSIPAEFFKHHEALSVPSDQIFAHLTSSGTTGQKSQMFFDSWTLQSAQRMVDFIFEYYGWHTPTEPANYLLYSYEPEEGSRLGTAYTDNFLCKYAPVERGFHALRATGRGTHEFDLFGTIGRLQDYAATGLPLRILGFPSFLWFTLRRMRELRIPPLKFPDQSLVFLGGGWKGHADQQISKSELYSQVTEQLGIPDHRIRDGFGSVEHCIPYVECRNHQFHVPIWSLVYIRDIRSLKPLGFGEPGFLHFVSPYITSVPAQSVLMGDLASLHSPQSCGCGVDTPYFKTWGRAGTSKNRSCAVAAAELLKGLA